MLTRDDLLQIRGVVKEEIQSAIRSEVRDVVKEEVQSAIQTEVRGVVKEEVAVQLKPVNRKLTRLQKDMTLIVKDYTNAIVHVRKRVEKIEDHLHL